MGNLTREQILARKLGTGEVELPDGSGTVRVRGLNRREALEMARVGDIVERDIQMVALGLVDPKLSEDDVRMWGEHDDSGTIEAVSRRIGELSRMVEGAGKSRVPSVRRRA